MDTTTEASTEATTDTTAETTAGTATEAPEAPFVAEVRTRVEAIARDVVAHTTSVAVQVGDLAGVTAERVRSELTSVRDGGRERLGDARGRVQPVVEQVQARATHFVGAGIERARTLVGRGADRAA